MTKIFGDPQAKTLKRLTKKVTAINAKTDHYRHMSDGQLRAQTEALKKRLARKGTSLDDLLPDAFALVREAAGRRIGMRHFDVQLIGGMALHEGNVAEMKTGEGKTLVATLAVYLNALEGRGVHVVTVNDYLAQRDAGWMGAIYDFLGMSVGVIIADQSFLFDPDYDNGQHDDPRMRKLRPCGRKEAYRADITYGTNNEFGFDYLRDNMVNDIDLLRQRDLNFAIVDEVDSILIDEARTPLIISAPAAESAETYRRFAAIVAKLNPEDYVLDEKHKSVNLSDRGVEKVERLLGIGNLYGYENVRSVYHIEQALRAQTLFKRDKDYVVSDAGEVIIVDEFTGRLMHGRRYSEGLHQALEAKEGVPVLQEMMTLATISFQNYFRLYKKLSGMTGTAYTEAEEFQQIYGLDVVRIPPNKPLIREDRPDMIFKTEAGKIAALVDDVKGFQQQGRPVLIGSASIQKNEMISRALTRAGVTHETLNAKNNEREAAIIARAGTSGAVTLATNIAGRGTDIVLDQKSKKLGGLVVLGSERHEARRIDNQLRGRAGRQGDPGLTQFYVSTEDDLMRIFQGERIAALMDRLGVDDGVPIQNRAVSRTLEAAQKRVEGYNFDRRKNVVQYDNVMNRHRKAVYSLRRQILLSQNSSGEIRKLIKDKALSLSAQWPAGGPELAEALRISFNLTGPRAAKLSQIKKEKERLQAIITAAEQVYAAKEKELTPQLMRQVEREVYLQVMDTLWMQHLEDMQHLLEGIGLRGYGQRDPLVEYRHESQRMYEGMQNTLRGEILGTLLRIKPGDISVMPQDGEGVIETELTKAAERSVEQGVNEIADIERDVQFAREPQQQVIHSTAKQRLRLKQRKNQRKNKKKGRRR